VPVGDLFVQELWHGPTLAFKDIALQLLGNLFEYILARRGGRLNILAATSGDTGSAAIYGCRGRAGVNIFVMHPRGRVSAIQQRQMTTVMDDNVHNIAIDGSFDDCQNIMKTLAADLEFKRKHSLGAVNSVNWARVLAQVVYYFAGSFDVSRATGAPALRVAVPTGNFGDILAGWYAMKMGAPIEQLILATNENDILCRFFSTGQYALGKVFHTLSPSMDIQVASNFERYLYYKLGSNPVALDKTMSQFAKTGAITVSPDRAGVIDTDITAIRASQQEVLDTIASYYHRYGYVLDPHSAVGVFAAERVRREASATDALPIMSLATAHPAKFPDAIAQATGQRDLARHPAIDAIMDMETRCVNLPNDTQAVRDFVTRTVAG
jgi:threonine synthase